MIYSMCTKHASVHALSKKAITVASFSWKQKGLFKKIWPIKIERRASKYWNLTESEQIIFQ